MTVKLVSTRRPMEITWAATAAARRALVVGGHVNWTGCWFTLFCLL